MSSYAEDDLRKNLKHLYDDLLDAETTREKDPSGYKNKLQVIYENLQYQEERICAVFGLGDFGVLRDYEPEYLRLGDSGVYQTIKSQIKALAVEIELDLEQEYTDNSNEITHKHKWTRGEKIGLVSVIVAVIGIAIAFFI